ncbi:putative cartilage matrix-associated protein [Hippocampus comes]|uniref:putative cartilage matrix-associated protein n=1 Tax=Hippocampus comes TaxID=109280 RepID=UPI00094EBBAF|nr:PREDICTED: unique cartilage matrix-associated protein-like [Hippocampus comes]
MSWTCRTFLALLTVLVALSLCPEADCAAVPSGSQTATEEWRGPLRRIFMKEADASNFFRRRSRRALKSPDELNAEQRQVLAADERRREFHEEKRQEFESYVEEVDDEQNERSRESAEQWREFHDDGMRPPYEYNRRTD